MKAATRDRRSGQYVWQVKPVTEHIVLPSAHGPSLYYLCPNCKILLPREYMRFCDCCGQRLGWNRVAAAEENV